MAKSVSGRNLGNPAGATGSSSIATERRRHTGMRRVLIVAALAAALLYPMVFTLPFPRHLMIMVFLYATLGQAWNILGGYCGQVSLGHAVFFGLGAYTPSVMATFWGVNPWLGMVAGIVVAVIVSQAIGWPCFRLGGHYFAIATIAIGEIVQTVFINWDAVGGARGIWLLQKQESLATFQFHTSKWPYYYIILGMFIAAWATTFWIERSKLGYYLRAVRDEPDAAQSLGINLARIKLRAMGISAAFAAAAGTFYAQYVLFIDPESVFPLMLSVLVALVAIVGGVGTLWGPLVGALIMIPLSEWTRIQLGGTGKAVDLIVYGVLIIVIAVVQPNGLLGWTRGWRGHVK